MNVLKDFDTDGRNNSLSHEIIDTRRYTNDSGTFLDPAAVKRCCNWVMRGMRGGGEKEYGYENPPRPPKKNYNFTNFFFFAYESGTGTSSERYLT